MGKAKHFDAGKVRRVVAQHRGLGRDHADGLTLVDRKIDQRVVLPRVEFAHTEHRHVLAALKAKNRSGRVRLAHQHHAGGADLRQHLGGFDAAHNLRIAGAGFPGVQRGQVQPDHHQHMQARKHSQAFGARFKLGHRQGERQQRKAKRVKRHDPVQADDFFQRQQREECQGHDHRTGQNAPGAGTARRGAQGAPVPRRQPKRRRGDEVGHHAHIGQGLAPLEHLGFVAVVKVEHDVRPAVAHVVGDVDGRAGQRAQHQNGKAGQPVAPVQHKVSCIRQPQHHREVFGQKRAGQQQT